jgi:hypothetical protein
VQRRFGAPAYAAGFRRILESFDDGTVAAGKHAGGGEIGERVLRAFLQPDQLRLLYDEIPDALESHGASEIQ